ncbi:MAG TPA: hypothetical protein VFZ65_21815 [Planctomycetota bacterium]|nr:hypothetical protein [Planctomycetota bacterium]
MGAKVHYRIAVLLAAACNAVGCASSPELPRSVTIETGRRTSVTLTQTQGRMVLALQNESSGGAAQVYSDERSNPLAKVVPDAQLQALLDVFTAKGLFNTSMSTVPPDARDVLAVEQGGQRWIWARRQAGIDAEPLFHEAKAYFLDVYNSSTAYHGHADDERPDLKGEMQRAHEDALTAKQKLEALRKEKQQ